MEILEHLYVDEATHDPVGQQTLSLMEVFFKDALIQPRIIQQAYKLIPYKENEYETCKITA